MINRKLDIFEAEEIKAVFDFMKSEKDIVSISELEGISTIESNTLVLLDDVTKIYLQVGQHITINKINYVVLSVDLKLKKFTIEAVDLVATKWNLAINFKVGSRTEINELLDIETKSNDTKLQRFPLAWLFINEIEQTDSQQFDHKSSVKIAFVHMNTKINDRVLGRLDTNFKTVIQPICTLFDATIRSPYFCNIFQWNYTEDNKTKYNRFFYGSSDKNESVLSTPTDAIEAQFELTFQNQY